MQREVKLKYDGALIESMTSEKAGARARLMKKKVDPRVRQLLESAVASHTRAFFVIVGDKGREQVVNLHYIMSKATVKARPTVLWCYKKELGFSSHKQKRMKEIKKKAQRGQIDIETIQDDPFELFITSTKIRYCYYNETHTILGHTYGMLVLQDFEAMTPNLLARTIETVEGGGCVVLLLKTMTSLKQLYSMTMDVHSRFRTHSHQSVVARFNERFLLSLRDCATCLVLDDGAIRHFQAIVCYSNLRNRAECTARDRRWPAAFFAQSA